ncbi:MAG: ubiquitin-conjugating enzyme E2 [Candidatus Helarchaeota archaeon]
MSQFEFILAREAQLMYRRARDFEPVSGNLAKWRGSIPGRGKDKHLKFEVEINIPSTFPQTSPQVTVVTPAEHPQIDPSTGNLTLRILSYWRPEYHLYQVVNSIKGLFARIPPKFPDTFSSTLTSPKDQKIRHQIPKSPTPPPPAFQSPSQYHIPPSPFVSKHQHHSSPSHSTTQISSPDESPLSSPSSDIPEESPRVKELKKQISSLEEELASLQSSLMNKTEEVARLESQMDVHNVPRTGRDRIEQIIRGSSDKDTKILDLQSEKIALEDLIQTLEQKFEEGEIESSEYAKLYKSYQKQLHLVNLKLKELKST